MTPDELDAATKQYDRFIPIEETRPLSHKAKALWQKAQRAKRPKNADLIVVAVDKKLLAKTDSLARQRKMTRSELIDRSLRSALAFTEP
jgi:hypothetical protein